MLPEIRKKVVLGDELGLTSFLIIQTYSYSKIHQIYDLGFYNYIFSGKENHESEDDDIDSEESSDDDELFENPNHRHFCYEDSSEEESSEYEEDDGEEDGEDCCDNDTELESQIKKVSLE